MANRKKVVATETFKLNDHAVVLGVKKV